MLSNNLTDILEATLSFELYVHIPGKITVTILNQLNQLSRFQGFIKNIYIINKSNMIQNVYKDDSLSVEKCHLVYYPE